MTGFRIAALCLVTLLASPAAQAREALSTDTAAAMLSAATGEDQLRAAYEVCLTLGGKDNSPAEAFAKAGWDAAGDDETGTTEIAGPNEIYVLTWSDGDFCLVQSETVGSGRAAVLLSEVFAATGVTAVPQPDWSECTAFSAGPDGPTVEVTSSGNDPVCASPDNSGVSFQWDTGE